LSGGGDGNVKLWDIPSNRLVHTFSGQRTGFDVTALATSPDGAYFAAGYGEGGIEFWHIAERKLMWRKMKAHRDMIRSLSFSADGLLLASGSNDQMAKVWRTNTGQLLRELKGHKEYVTLAFSSEGSKLASGGGEKIIRLWDARIGKPLTTFNLPASRVETVGFIQKDTQVFAAGDGVARVWDLGSGRIILDQPLPSKTVYALSPKGTKFATSQEQTSIEVLVCRPASYSIL